MGTGRMVESSPTVLHIEDNEANRYIVRRILQNAGFQVVEATSGESGLQAVEACQPDLVILDVRLPGMNGFEVCRQIKANPETTFLPVLHLSASFVRSQDKVQGLDSGADAYLAQPVEPVELVATVRSLLRIRQAEESALSLGREWQTTFDSISDGVSLLDTEGRFLRCNNSLIRLLQRPVEEILGQPHKALLQEAVGLGDGQCFSRMKTSRHRETLEIFFKERWFLKTMDPVLDEQGNFTGAVFILLDITDRKRIEDERAHLLALEQEARAASEMANRLKDEFLATLSHELRSPLNSILGWIQLLNTRDFDEATTARAMETIERNAKVQAQLVEDLLDVSRIIQGKLRLNVGSVDLPQIVAAAIDTVRPSADAKEIQLQFWPDPKVRKITGDGDRLQQVIWNLLSNAVKFTPRGGKILVQLEQVNIADASPADTSPENASPAYIQITVTDTGQGIDPEFVPFVFDRFRQADSSMTRLYSGLGLGLALVRHLVELHGGTVQANSPGVGQGAVFTVKLPTTPAQVEPSFPTRSAPTTPPQPLQDVPELKGIRVVVVDDEADTRDLLTTSLEACGAIAFPVASAQEAIATISASPVDVLISDIGMPEEDGYSLIRKVRTLPATQGGTIPAIALTAYARVEDQARALADGFHVHLSKPVEPDQLVAVVANLIKKFKGN